MEYFIYLTINTINNKKYIGQHRGERDDDYLGSGVALKKAINKYGKENFKREILEFCEEEELNEKEKYWIKKYNAVEDENFYNLSEGGQEGDGWQACRRYFENHPSEAQEVYHNNYQKLLQWQQKNPDKVQKNIDKMLEGAERWRSNNKEQVLEHMKFVNEKKEEWQQAHQEEHQEEIKKWIKAGSDANSIKIKCITTGEIFNSLSEASRYYNIPQPNITRNLKGKGKSAGKHPITGEKLVWEYYNE